MALFTRSRLFGLLFLLALPLEGAAALALSAAQQAGVGSADAEAGHPLDQPHQANQPLSLEERLARIASAVHEQHPQLEAGEGVPDDALSYVFVNSPGIGWGNGGFRNGGFYNGGFRNGGFYNGGFRNGGGWRNGGFRNGGFRNYW